MIEKFNPKKSDKNFGLTKNSKSLSSSSPANISNLATAKNKSISKSTKKGLHINKKPNLIEFKDISFSYQDNPNPHKPNLQNINLQIKKGELLILCGESGCGKTTLGRLINGLIPHYYEGELKGKITIAKQNISQMPLYDISKKVGSVFQNPRSQFFNIDTTSEIAFGCENQGLPPKEICRRVNQVVDYMQLEKLLNRDLFELSGGEKQKIACASVSACQPDIYVLDEPSSNLDTRVIMELKKLIGKWKNEGKTIIVAEHRLYFLKDLADRILYMKEGQIAKIYSGQEFAKLSNQELALHGLRPTNMKKLVAKMTDSTKKTIQEKKPKIKLKNFNFGYKKANNILDIKELTLPQNKIIALIGPNGAGKSTLARCLCGLEKSCPGYVEINNQKLKNKARLFRSFMVMQDVNHQLFTESVLDEVLLSMDEPNKNQAIKVLQGLNLDSYKDYHPMSLSGGEKQRLAIASAVASQSDFVLFDEPTSGLDLRHMREVAQNLIKLRDAQKTIFVISHDPELILSCCDYVLSLEAGKIKEHYYLNNNSVEKLLNSFFNILPIKKAK